VQSSVWVYPKEIVMKAPRADPVWVVDARGRRVTQSEDIVSKDELIGRLNELIPNLCRL
jgi:hypothetical protein